MDNLTSVNGYVHDLDSARRTGWEAVWPQKVSSMMRMTGRSCASCIMGFTGCWGPAGCARIPGRPPPKLARNTGPLHSSMCDHYDHATKACCPRAPAATGPVGEGEGEGGRQRGQADTGTSEHGKEQTGVKMGMVQFSAADGIVLHAQLQAQQHLLQTLAYAKNHISSDQQECLTAQRRRFLSSNRDKDPDQH